MFDASGDIDYGASTFNGSGNTNVKWHGGEGDDIIWGSKESIGDSIYYGGNGDDTFYPSFNAATNTNVKFVGQGGQDYFDLDFFGENGTQNVFYQIWGDWAYGPEDDPYNYGLQYGDPNLEEQLQGDDDVIFVPNSRPDRDRPGKRLDVFAGDGEDTVTAGEGWGRSFMNLGRGDDTLYLPTDFRRIYGYGGAGDDQMIAIPEETAREIVADDRNLTQNLYGGAGNDRLEGNAKVADTRILGEDDNDKLIGGNDNEMLFMAGGDDDDIIYGGDRTVTSEELFGDSELNGTGTPVEGGNDQIFGGHDILGTQTIAGGTFDDWIWSGTNVTGDIKIYGDNDTSTPLTEDATALNINDGNDIINIGNGNGDVFVWGQGGNDKIIGGHGESQVEKLYGGSGDDKIWLVSPGQRSLDTAADANYGYGNDGNDNLYGSAA